jgi:hypothetical protein
LKPVKYPDQQNNPEIAVCAIQSRISAEHVENAILGNIVIENKWF